MGGLREHGRSNAHRQVEERSGWSSEDARRQCERLVRDVRVHPSKGALDALAKFAKQAKRDYKRVCMVVTKNATSTNPKVRLHMLYGISAICCQSKAPYVNRLEGWLVATFAQLVGAPSRSGAAGGRGEEERSPGGEGGADDPTSPSTSQAGATPSSVLDATPRPFTRPASHLPAKSLDRVRRLVNCWEEQNTFSKHAVDRFRHLCGQAVCLAPQPPPKRPGMREILQGEGSRQSLCDPGADLGEIGAINAYYEGWHGGAGEPRVNPVVLGDRWVGKAFRGAQGATATSVGDLRSATGQRAGAAGLSLPPGSRCYLRGYYLLDEAWR